MGFDVKHIVHVAQLFKQTCEKSANLLYHRCLSIDNREVLLCEKNPSTHPIPGTDHSRSGHIRNDCWFSQSFNDFLHTRSILFYLMKS